MDTVNKTRRTKFVTKSRRVSARLNSVKKSPSKGNLAGTDEEDSLCARGNSFVKNSGSLDKITQEKEYDEMQEPLKKSAGFFQEKAESIHETLSYNEIQPKDTEVDVDVQQKCEDLQPPTDNETLSHDDEAIDLEEFGSDFSGDDLLGKNKHDLAISVQQVKEESLDKIMDELQDSAIEVDQDLGKNCIVIDLKNLDFDLIDLICSAFGMMSSCRTGDSSNATMTYSKMTDAILAARVLGRLQLGATRLSVRCSLIANDAYCDHLEEEQDLMTKISEILSDEDEEFTWYRDSVESAGTAVEANQVNDKKDPSQVEEDPILSTLETNKRPREEQENFDHGQQGAADKKRSRYERLTMEKETEEEELEGNKESVGDGEEEVDQPEGSDYGLDIEDVGIDFEDDDEDMFDYEYSEEEIDKEHTNIAKMLLENKDKSWEALDMEDAFANPCHKESSDSISTIAKKIKIPEMANDVKMVNLLLKSVDDTPLLDSFVKEISAIKVFFVESFHQSDEGWQLAVPKCYAAEIRAVLDGCRLLDCTLAASLDTVEDISRNPWDHFLPVREEMNAFVRYYNKKQLRKYVNLFIYSHSMDPLTYKTMVCNSKKCHVNDCMFSHSPAALRQPVVYRSDNGRNLSLFKSPNGKYNKNIITNFFNRICEHASPSGECSVFTFCRNSHPDSPDMFFHKSWTDLYVKGLNKSLPFLAGAIRNLTVHNARRPSPKKDKKQQQKTNKSCMVLFITQSLESVQLARQAIQHLCNTHCQPIAVNLDKPSSECTPVVIATLSQVLSAVVQNSSLFVSVKCLILDDASALLAGDNASMLQYFFSRLWIVRRNPETVNKVVVCSKVQQDEVARMESLLQTTFNMKSSVPIIDKYLPSNALDVPGNSKALELQNSDAARNATCDLHAKKLRELAMVSYTEASSSNELATHPRTPKGIPTVPNAGSLSRGLSYRLGHVESPFPRRAPVNGGETIGQTNRGHGSLERTRGSRRDRSLTHDHRAKDRDRSLHAEHDVSGIDYDRSPRMEHEDRHLSRSLNRGHFSNSNSFCDSSSDRNRGRNGPISSSAYKMVNRQGREGLLPAERLVASKRAPAAELLRDNAGEQIRAEQESFRDELVSRARNVESRPRALLPTPRLKASQHSGQASSSRLNRQQAIDVEQATLRKRQQDIELEQATLRKRQQAIEFEQAKLERQNMLEEHQLSSRRPSRASLDSREELISRSVISSSPWDQLPLSIVDRTGEEELHENRSRRNGPAAQHLARYDSSGYDEAPAVLKRAAQNRRFNTTQPSAPPQLSRLRSSDPAPIERSKQWRLDTEALSYVFDSSDRGSHARKPLPLATAPSKRRSQQRQLDDETFPFAPVPSGRGSRRLNAEAIPFFPAPSDREAHTNKPGTHPLARSQKWRLDAEARSSVPAPSDRETYAGKATVSVAQKRSQQWRLDDEALLFASAPSGDEFRRVDSEADSFFHPPSYREPLAHKPMPPASQPLQRKPANGAASAGAPPAATGGRSSSGLQAMLNSLVSASHAVPAVGPAVEAIALAAANYGQNTRKALDLLAEPDHVSLLKVYLSQLQEINETDSTNNGIYGSTLVYGKGLLNLIKKHVVL